MKTTDLRAAIRCEWRRGGGGCDIGGCDAAGDGGQGTRDVGGGVGADGGGWSRASISGERQVRGLGEGELPRRHHHVESDREHEAHRGRLREREKVGEC